MIRHLAIATLAAAALTGCVSDYAYRGGPGDYYYGRPSVEYYDYGYGAPYGSYGYPGGWYGGIGYGYGYPYGYYGGGGYYPYYPYYWYRRPHHNHRPPDEDAPHPVTGGRLPPNRYDGPNPPIQSQAVPRPREGARPMRPPMAGGDWRDAAVARPPASSRPMPPMVREGAGSRGRAPVSAPRRASPPPMARPARPQPAMNLPEREPVRNRKR